MGDRMASDPLPVVHKCFSLEISWGGGGEGTTYVESEEKKEAGYLEEKNEESGVRKDTSETPRFPLGCPPASWLAES